MREPKAEWVTALKALDSGADLRWNASVGRWEFILSSADGVPRSQFWGWFYQVVNGQQVPIEPDPVTGLHPYRDLDDAAMAEALRNLERTFIGNPFDGAGSTRKEVRRRMRYNEAHAQRQYRAAGEAFADMAAERKHRLRGAPIIHVATALTPRGSK